MNVSLEPIAANLQKLLEETQRLREDVRDVKRQMEEFRSDRVQFDDEMTVLTGMVLRHASEHIARGGVQSRLERLEERIARLEQTRPGAP